MALRTPSEAVAYATTHLTSGYNGLCLAHVQDAYGAVPVEPSAISAWNNSKWKHPTTDLASAPYGAPIYFSQPGNPYGHVALHLNGDLMYTTDSGAGHPHTASINDWQRRYGYRPLGWTGDIENQPIPGLADDADEPQKTTTKKEEPMTALILANDNTGVWYYWSPQTGRIGLANTDEASLLQQAGLKVVHYRKDLDWAGRADDISKRVRTVIDAQETAQTAAIEALSKAMGADPDQIAQAVQQAVKAKLDSLEITITATDGTDQ